MANGRTFDPKQVKVQFGAITLSGFAKGTAIKVSTDGDDFTLEKGIDGEYERINNNNNLLTIEVTLKQTDPTNDLLSAHRQLDKSTNIGMVPFLIKDMGPGGTTLVGGLAHIKKAPDLVVADTLQPRTWVFEGPGKFYLGGNAQS